MRPFVGADGEGGDIDGRHQYLLLRAGGRVLETGRPLTTLECLGFLADLPTDVEHVAYFFDYDTTMMLRGLPEERIRRLLDRQSRVYRGSDIPRPLQWGGYELDYLPHKELRVRRLRPFSEHAPWVVISDVGTFFQAAFLKTLQKWGIGTDENLLDIAKGKESRAEFGALTEDTRRYNALEIELLEDLMQQFRRVCIEVGYVPRLWQGPGNLATSMLSKHRLPRRKDLEIPDDVWRYAQNAYYGGRFETTAVGPVTGPVYQYDINSAYPWACTQLPCLLHSTWHHTHTFRGLGVYQIKFNHRPTSLYSFPVRRKDGSIHFPRMGGGWYWWPEIDAGIDVGADVSVRDGWYISQGCDCEPFGWVRDVYAERLRLGKSGRGMVLKLGLNSLYGKQAQSIGSAPYANPINAGLITSRTRATLVPAYSHNPASTVMLATDGIFTLDPLPVTPTPSLGGWDLKTHEEGMFIIQPGLYFAGTEKPKTRGVPMGAVFERRQEFEQAWADSFWGRGGRVPRRSMGRGRGPEYPAVTLPLRNFISLRLGMARNRPDTIGEWLPVEKSVSFDWSTKRRPGKVEHDGRALRTFPYDSDLQTITVPYDKVIGGNDLRDLERLEWEDAPDWAQDLRGWV